MRHLPALLLAFASAFALSLPAHAATSDSSPAKRPVDWVNPLIDTVKPRWFYFASAARPFGLVALSPDTHTEGDWNAGYRYRDTRIQCFSHLHEWQLAGLPVMPVLAATDLADPSSEFSRDNEIVRPGYHRLDLTTHRVTAELTSTARVGFHRYTFPSGESSRLFIDLSRTLMECKMSDWETHPNADRTELTGSFTLSRTHRRPKPVRVHFHAAFDRPFTLIGDPTNGKVLLDFAPPPPPPTAPGSLLPSPGSPAPLLAKFALSFTDTDGARRNLAAELPHWDFDRVVAESRAEWDSWLSRIEVEDGTPAQNTKLYTDLWHSLLGRRRLDDVDGRYPDHTGSTFTIRQTTDGRPHHNFDALWGAHWSLNLLWPLAWPEKMDDFASTMLRMYRDGGLIPRGPSGGNYTFVMIGDPAASFFAAAHFKGIRNWDTAFAYEGLRKNAFPGGIRSHAGYEHRRTDASGGGIAHYVERGYIPEDIPGGQGGHRQGAAMTLEYAYQDHALALLADTLGKPDDAALFKQRAQNYRNVWDPAAGWMRPRRLDGSWYEPFAPVTEGFAAKGFVESASAVYSFYVPHDLPGLASLFGGPAAAADRLEDNFRRAEPLRFITDHGNHAVAWVDYENQPSTQMAHLFSHFGRPWRSQYWVRKVHDAAFSDTTPFGGYNGDEDQGQMGALSALMALGLFDVEGGVSLNPHYEITAPKFSRITFHLDPRYYPGKTFTITAGPQTPENIYIQSARLNGEPLHSFRFPHRAFAAGGTLELTLGPTPNESWGLATP
jgi:predicted alpha-1,2-mannosidase